MRLLSTSLKSLLLPSCRASASLSLSLYFSVFSRVAGVLPLHCCSNVDELRIRRWPSFWLFWYADAGPWIDGATPRDLRAWRVRVREHGGTGGKRRHSHGGGSVRDGVGAAALGAMALGAAGVARHLLHGVPPRGEPPLPQQRVQGHA